jgi:hypothetical protein
VSAALECPGCGAPHPASERFCTACGLPLVHAPGEASPPRQSEARERARKVNPSYAQGELVKIARARHQAEAELLQGLLLEEGIPSLARRSGGFDVPDFLASGPRDILVPSGAVEAARAMLPAPAAGRAGLAGGTPPWVRALAVALAVLLLAVVAAGVLGAVFA